MVSVNEKWIRIFDIPETSEHRNGFTIYKVISMVRLKNVLFQFNYFKIFVAV